MRVAKLLFFIVYDRKLGDFDVLILFSLFLPVVSEVRKSGLGVGSMLLFAGSRPIKDGLLDVFFVFADHEAV